LRRRVEVHTVARSCAIPTYNTPSLPSWPARYFDDRRP
jgi:hypothetical protein